MLNESNKLDQVDFLKVQQLVDANSQNHEFQDLLQFHIFQNPFRIIRTIQNIFHKIKWITKSKTTKNKAI